MKSLTVANYVKRTRRAHPAPGGTVWPKRPNTEGHTDTHLTTGKRRRTTNGAGTIRDESRCEIKCKQRAWGARFSVATFRCIFFLLPSVRLFLGRGGTIEPLRPISSSYRGAILGLPLWRSLLRPSRRVATVNRRVSAYRCRVAFAISAPKPGHHTTLAWPPVLQQHLVHRSGPG